MRDELPDTDNLDDLALALIDVEIDHHTCEALAHMDVGLNHPKMRADCYRAGRNHGRKRLAWRMVRSAMVQHLAPLLPTATGSIPTGGGTRNCAPVAPVEADSLAAYRRKVAGETQPAGRPGRTPDQLGDGWCGPALCVCGHTAGIHHNRGTEACDERLCTCTAFVRATL